MKSLPIDRPTLDDPVYSQKNPYQTFLMGLSVVSSLPLLSGHSGSAVMDEALSDFVVTLWGLLLLIGSLVVLAGEFWRGHTWTSLVIERTGLLMVSAGAFIYTYTLYRAVPLHTAMFPLAITLAYALSCLWRAAQITGRLRWIRSLIQEVNDRHAQP